MKDVGKLFSMRVPSIEKGTDIVRKPNDLLRTARENRGWKQAQVADMIGCPNSVNISRWENGMTIPNRYYRQKLCELYGKDAVHLGFVQGDDEEDLSHLTKPIFLFNEPLPAAEELYGRKREKETLIARTARKASTSITGPRRIGKTWLMHYLRLVTPERLGPRFRLGYLDGMLPQCKTVVGFAAEALRKLNLPVPENNEGLASLDKGLQELVSKKIVPVLCIDEFESFSSRPEFSRDFFEGLRAMTQVSDLVLVIASKNPLHLVVTKNAQGSPFFNIFERLFLKPFPYTDTEQFIQEKGKQASFTPQERDYLWKYGRVSDTEKAWLPLRLQLAGKILEEELDQARRDPHYRQSFEERFKMTYEAVMS
jgi:transcriptional regulator with XRE-family HTH domain